MTAWHEAVLDFWFGLEPARHWRPDPELDEEIRARFGRLWEEQKAQPVERFLGSPEQALAAVILFDQFPRNMFRDDRRAFATDPFARRIASAALDRGFDERLAADRRLFLYMPFEHSEALADQERSLRLFRALGDPEKFEYAKSHHEVIARFGRFPHRNAVLGRESTEEEEEFGLEPAW